MNTFTAAKAVTITDRAAAQVASLLSKREKPAVGIKVGIRTRGCSGLSYTIEYADEIGKFEIFVIAGHGVRSESAAMTGDRRRHAKP